MIPTFPSKKHPRSGCPDIYLHLGEATGQPVEGSKDRSLRSLVLYDREGVDKYPNINKEQYHYRDACHDLLRLCYMYGKALLKKL